MNCKVINKNKKFDVEDMMKYVIADGSVEEVNETYIDNWISTFESKIKPYLKYLKRIYKGVENISKLQFDNINIDNQVHSNLAAMIVHNATNYFIGKPITHTFSDKFSSKGLDKIINDINRTSKEKKENKTLAKDASIFGVGYELINYEKDKKMYFKRLDPLNTFLIVNDFVFKEELAYITYEKIIVNGKYIKKGYCYTKDWIYEFDNSSNAFKIVDRVPNVLKEIPVVIFPNNDEWAGDFEFVTELLNAYNKLISCSFDDFESIANALLVIYNALLDEEERELLKNSRMVSLVSSDGQKDVKAEYIYKKLDTASFKEMRTAIKEDIITITNVPDLNDENFAGNQSGVAISYKLIGFENLRADKQTYFDDAIQKRYELIGKNPLNSFELEEGDIVNTFYQNLPKNIEKDLQISQLYKDGTLSLESTLDEMEIVDDTAKELKRIEDEEKANIQKQKEALNEELPTNMNNKNRLKV